MVGKIIKQISNDYTVKVDNDLYICKARGKFRKLGITPLVGDNVVIDEDNNYILEILDRKNEFKITLKNNKLSSIVNWVNYMNSWRNDCQWFAKNNDSEMMKTPRIENIDLPGKFEITVSKNNILNDSVILDNPGIKSEFRNITHTVEKVVLSPIQTIVRINHSATQQSSNAFANRYPGVTFVFKKVKVQ